MIEKLPAERFLERARSVPVIDVRSPAEFIKGHIPGAHNIPLFDDMERSDVGKLYHQAGRDDAVFKGIEIAGPKMKTYVEEAKDLAINDELLLYCWRGGMRSESMAWLFNTSGIKTAVLEKGYKGFRKHNRDHFERQQPMIIIGGKTGSGKTDLLNQLPEFGLQTVDLEKLASHKGSVFGNLGLPEQPTNEHFENMLGMAWQNLDPDKPVFLEDESFNIGRDSIPPPIYEQMKRAPVFFINMPLDSRLERLYREYAQYPQDVLTQMINKISRKLGGANAKAAIKAIEENRLKDAIRISLLYYDKAYGFDIKKRSPGTVFYFDTYDENIVDLAELMVRKVTEMNIE